MPRQQYYTIGLFSGLIAAVLWGYFELARSETAAATAAQSLNDCRRLAGQIVTLQAAPARAQSAAQADSELTRRIELAAQSAQLPTDRLMRIDPEPPRRVGDTDYREQPTHLELRDVTLQQLVRFLLELSGGESGLEVPQLRLTAPRRDSAGPETWDVEVTLTYLIFSPKTGAAKRG